MTGAFAYLVNKAADHPGDTAGTNQAKLLRIGENDGWTTLLAAAIEVAKLRAVVVQDISIDVLHENNQLFAVASSHLSADDDLSHAFEFRTVTEFENMSGMRSRNMSLRAG
ncbi:hypothetical protein N8I77_013563 [Diaporthe amygdali]|uniref:Uncharacterized protein n=1 Tax=Phomopsis amygdali TaxID=1214568 RepID=A0AAD9S3L8_PHOAM|nr:hypothetical protein N8I77_013563 [Diaporthe amygdali]